MRRHIPGLHSKQHDLEVGLDGLFLVRVEKSRYRFHAHKPFWELGFVIIEPNAFKSPSLGACIAQNARCGNSIGSLTTSAMTPNCSNVTRWTKKRS